MGFGVAKARRSSVAFWGRRSYMLERKGGGRKGKMLGFRNIFCHFLKNICFNML